jgi:hypothetical protein
MPYKYVLSDFKKMYIQIYKMKYSREQQVSEKNIFMTGKDSCNSGHLTKFQGP